MIKDYVAGIGHRISADATPPPGSRARLGQSVKISVPEEKTKLGDGTGALFLVEPGRITNHNKYLNRPIHVSVGEDP